MNEPMAIDGSSDGFTFNACCPAFNADSADDMKRWLDHEIEAWLQFVERAKSWTRENPIRSVITGRAADFLGRDFDTMGRANVYLAQRPLSRQAHAQVQTFLDSIDMILCSDQPLFKLITDPAFHIEKAMQALDQYLEQIARVGDKQRAANVAKDAERLLASRADDIVHQRLKEFEARIERYGEQIEIEKGKVIDAISAAQSIEAVSVRWDADAVEDEYEGTWLLKVATAIGAFSVLGLVLYAWPRLEDIKIDAAASLSDHLRRVYVILELAGVAAIVIWIARVLIRLGMQRLDRAFDNRRRVAAGKAYLGLATTGKVTLGTDESKIIYSAMFAETQRSAIDDGSPTIDTGKIDTGKIIEGVLKGLKAEAKTP